MADNTLSTPVRLLLVGPLAGVRAQVTAALAEVPGPPQLYWCAEFHLALTQALNIMPQLVLVMCGESVPGGLNAIRQFAGRLPGLPVLALVDGASVAQAREAVLAGAQGFLTHPVQAAELASSLTQALSRSTAGVALRFAPQGQVVAFIGPKGGVGRTTLAINTAISLHQTSHQAVVMVDADFGAPALDVALNLRPAYTMADFLPKLANLDEQLLAGMLSAHASGIRVLAAPPPGELARPLTMPQIQHLLARLRRSFAWIVVDLGQPLDEMTLSFVDAADRVVVVINPEMVGVRNARLVMNQLARRAHTTGKTWLVLNRAGLRGGLAAQDLQNLVGWPIDFKVPNDQALATDTINRGRPVVLSHARSQVARACRALAAELMVSPTEVAERASPAPTAASPKPARRGARTELWLVLALIALAGLGGAFIAGGGLPAAPSAQLAAGLPQLPGRGVPPGAGTAPPIANAASLAGQQAAAERGQPPAIPAALPAPTSRPAPALAPAVEIAATLTPEPAAASTPTLAPTWTSTPQPTATDTPTLEPTRTPAPAPTSTAAPTVEPPGMQTAVAGLTATAATQVAAPLSQAQFATATTPSAMQTAVAGLTATAAALVPLSTPSATIAAARTPTRPPLRGAATRPRLAATATPPRATATAASRLPVVSYPALLAPSPNAAARGNVTFGWQPTGPLPPGTGYEVVWWNSGENPDAARGIAPPTTGTSLTVNFDILYDSHVMSSSQLYWTVLVVQLNPYARPIRPSPAAARLLTYAP